MIVMTCPMLEKQTPAMVRRLERSVDNAMVSGQGITSASGMTATLAVAWCEKHGYEFKMSGAGGRYYVTRGTKL